MAEGDKKTERRNLTITHVEEIKKVGDKQIPKLSFKAKDGDGEYTYFTFRSSLFELIKIGQVINADIETSTRIYDGNTYTDRRVVQIYVDGQPIIQKGQQGYRGKSPEELEQQARVMVLSYAKDLAVADKILVVEIINQAEVFYNWVKKNGVPKVPETKLEAGIFDSSEAKTPVPATKPNIDMDWLKESLENIPWPDAGKWLKQHYPEAKGVSVKQLVLSLTQEHQIEFVAEVQKRLQDNIF